jgi:hypothetical protein
MLALLIYCYITGRFGSRTIEAATYSDVAVRYLCANHHPDHASICAFRTANKQAFDAAFVTVLQLGHHLKLTKVGTVSVDGSKIQANASKHAAVSYARAGEMLAQLELEVKELTERAEQAEAHESKDTLDLPAELTRRQDRKAALQQARQVIEARAKELAAAQQPAYEAKQAKRQAQRDAGQPPRGREPKAPSATPEPKAQYNFTDPESCIMKAGSGAHFEQSYNAQAAVVGNPAKSMLSLMANGMPYSGREVGSSPSSSRARARSAASSTRLIQMWCASWVGMAPISSSTRRPGVSAPDRYFCVRV